VTSSIAFILIAILGLFIIEPAIHNEVFSSTANGAQLTNSGESFWSNGPDLPTLIWEHQAVVLEDKIYIIGGVDFIEGGPRTDTVRVFDITSNEWSIAPPLPTPLDHTAAATDGSRIYVVGGFSGTEPRREPSDRLFIYDPKTNEWQEGNRMSEPRAALTADFINGLLYAVGGINSAHIPVTTNEVYDPVSNSWSETTSMPTPRHHHVSAVVNGELYIIGGRILTDAQESNLTNFSDMLTNLNDNEKFDPVNKTWSIQEQMPTKRSGMAAEVYPVNGNIYVFGGENLTGAYNVTEIYDTKANKWSSGPDMPTPRLALEAVAIDNQIYILGGRNGLERDVASILEILNINQ
jgi:Kelch motif protein